MVAGRASEERPRWSPDATQLTYYSDASGSWDVYTVPGHDGCDAIADRRARVRWAAGVAADSRLGRLSLERESCIYWNLL